MVAGWAPPRRMVMDWSASWPAADFQRVFGFSSMTERARPLLAVSVVNATTALAWRGEVTLFVDGAEVGRGHVDRTHPFAFSLDTGSAGC